MSGAGLTRRGWALLMGAFALGAGAYLFGVDELYPLGAGSLVLVVAARTWVSNARWDVWISRTVRPSRLPEGTEARVFVSATNHNNRRSPVLVVKDRFEGGRLAAAFAVAPLEPGESREATYRLPAARRGLYKLRPLEMELCDPFGLARVVRVGAPGGSLTVHPRIELISPGSIPSDSDRDRRVPLPMLGRGGDEFYGLREYQLGDDLRRVHWASTARVDELIIRQPENLWRGRTTVLVDAQPAAHDRRTFESALSAAASLAVATLHAGMQARVVLTGGTDTGYGSGSGHEATILDTLAMSETQGGSGLGDEARLAGLSGSVVLITTDSASPEEVAAVLRRAGRTAAAVVVFLREGTDRAPNSMDGTGSRRWRQVVVPPGTTFRAAWSGLPTLELSC